jgi:hypothetical protein
VSSDLPDIEVCRRLWAFRCLGWIEQVDVAQEASVAASGAEEATKAEVAGDESRAKAEPEETISLATGGNSSKRASDAGSQAELKRASDAPVVSEPIAVSKGAKKPPEEMPASASLADLEETGFELDVGEPPETADPPGASTDMGLPYGTPLAAGELTVPEEDSGVEFSLEDPISVTSADSEASAHSLGEEPKGTSPTDSEAEKAPSEKPALDTDDTDLEGLGMVLGDDETK